MSKENIIRELYYNPETGFSGIEKLFQKLKTRGITRQEIAKFLRKQEVYQRNIKVNYKRNSFIPLFPLQEFQVDLIYLDDPNLNLHKYGLCAIDAFTKKATIELLKTKTMTEVADAMQRVFDTMGVPKMVYSDEGSEFIGSAFKKLLSDNDVELVLALNHATMIERFNRTIKEMMSKYLQSTKSKTITVVLPKILKNYNDSYHSTIGMAPNEVNDSNKHLVQMRLIQKGIKRKYAPLKVGDEVRVELKQRSMNKGYRPKFSEQIHKIVEKQPHHFKINNSNKMYSRANIMPVGEIEYNVNEPDNENTLESRAKKLNTFKGTVKYNIPTTNLSERKLRDRKLVSQNKNNLIYEYE